MSLRADGHYHCDRCGYDFGPASGIAVAAIVSDTEPGDTTRQRRLDLCLDRPDPEKPGKTIQGCRDRVLTKRALRNLIESQEASA